jgi:hypothetical protein
MSPEETLVYESSRRVRQTAIAIGGGVLFMLAAVLGLIGPHASVNEATLSLIVQHQRATLAIVAAIVEALAEILIAATLIYLWRCATARLSASADADAVGGRAGRSLPVLPLIIVIGTVLAVVAGVAYALEISAKAADFVSTGAQTYDEASRLTGGSLLLILQILSQLGALLIALSFVFVSLSAMRVGLLPKFLGYVGILAGVLVLFPIIVVPVVQLYWLAAVAILLSGSWPSGLPPAWRSGRAEPWPSSAEMRARRMTDGQAARDQRAARKRGGRVSDAPAPETAAEGAGSSVDAGRAATRSSSSKRKRKRRH